MRTVKARLAILLAAIALTAAAPPLPQSVRLYVFDCGRLEGGDVSRFRLKREEMATTDMSVACYLVAHPRGTMIWDAGAVPDGDIERAGARGTSHRYQIVLPNKAERFVTTTRTLASQLADAGFKPADIAFLTERAQRRRQAGSMNGHAKGAAE